MGALNFFAFRPLGEEVVKLQMTIIKFIYLLVTIIRSFFGVEQILHAVLQTFL